jgi:hypothetical protein
MSIKKARFLGLALSIISFCNLNWRKTTSDSIIAELLHARIHTTRKAEASE